MKFNPLLAKVLAVTFVVGLLTIALERIGSLVDERQARLHEAVASVEDSQAAARPCSARW